MKFHNIEPNNIQNGTGIRTVLWVSGCFHDCPGCHNPITHDPEDGINFDNDSLNELLDNLDREFINGLTISGGDPLTYYPADTLEVIQNVRNRFEDRKSIWVYTGFTLDWILNTIMSNTDKEVISTFTDIIYNIDVLCDGKFEQDNSSKDYHWVGSTNQRVIDMKETLRTYKLVFVEPEQELLCTINNDETNELLIKFKKYNLNK